MRRVSPNDADGQTYITVQVQRPCFIGPKAGVKQEIKPKRSQQFKCGYYNGTDKCKRRGIQLFQFAVKQKYKVCAETVYQAKRKNQKSALDIMPRHCGESDGLPYPTYQGIYEKHTDMIKRALFAGQCGDVERCHRLSSLGAFSVICFIHLRERK